MRHASPATLALALGIQLDDATAMTTNGGQQLPITKDEAFAKFTEGVMSDDVAPEEYADYVRSSRLVARGLQLSPGQLALVVNGRVSVSVENQCLDTSFSWIPYLFQVVGPIEPGKFHAADFKALEDYEYRKRTEPIVKAMEDVAPLIAKEKYAMLFFWRFFIVANFECPISLGCCLLMP